MGRVTKARRVCAMPLYARFAPQPDEAKAPVRMEIEDYECIRLMDYLGMTQEKCAVQMGVARTTVQGIYTRARRRPQQGHGCGQSRCLPQPHTAGGASMDVPPDLSATKGRILMRLAIPYDNGQVFQHFGRSEQFKIYEVADGAIESPHVLENNGEGHGALVTLLQQAHVDVLICGGIGAGAQNALKAAGIRFYGGVQGEADKAAADFLVDRLAYDPAVRCEHHGEGHGHGHGHGCHHQA